MRQLLLHDIKRFFLSPYYIISIIMLIWLHSLKDVGWIPIISNLFSWGDEFLYNSSILAVFLAIVIPVYLYDEYSLGMIHNKHILGYSKQQIYFCEIISCGVGASILVLFSSVIYCLRRQLTETASVFTKGQIVVNTLIFMSTFFLIGVIYVTISLLIKKRILTVAIIICASIFLISQGRSNLSILTYSESTLALLEENETDEGIDLIDSALRISEEGRMNLNAKITFSPFAQTAYASYLNIERVNEKANLSFCFKKHPYHIDFVIANAILSLIVMLLGTYLYQRKDL